MTNKTTSLAASLKADAASKISEIEIKSANTLRVAEAYDASGYAGRVPYIVSGDARVSYDGTIAALHFKDVAPDELTALILAFPPIPRAEYKHRGSRSFLPGDVPSDAEEVTPCDGLEISTSTGRGFNSLRASWSANVGEVNTRFWCTIKTLHYLHPRTHRHAITRNGEFLRYEGATTVIWPDDGKLFNDLKSDAGLFVRIYGSGSNQSHGDAHIRGRNVLALVQAWEAEANRRGEATKAAFLAAYAPLDYGNALPSLEMIEAHAETMRASYAAKAGGLRAGTLMQTAALDMDYAQTDRAVAEKHWIAYAEHYDLEKSRGYFDHFAWACAYLERVGLYTVPVTDAMRSEAKGGIAKDSYKYGERWL